MQTLKRQKLTNKNAFKKRCVEFHRNSDLAYAEAAKRCKTMLFSAVMRYKQKVLVTVLLISLRTSIQTSLIISLP